MKVTNIIISGLATFIIASLIGLSSELKKPINIYSDGQAGVGTGVIVLIIQLIKVGLVSILFILILLVSTKRGFRTYFSLINLVFLLGGLLLAFFVIPL